MCSRAKRLATRQAFSLIEFTVVLALIGLLAGIVTINVRGHMIRGKQNAARGEISTICSALETYYTIMGRYPTTDEGLSALVLKNDKIADPLLNSVPVDPWGHAYVYNQPGRSDPYEVICLGADGREGGEGGDTDIASFNLRGDASSTGASTGAK